MILEVDKLNAFYGKAQILFDVSLNLAAGEVVALMGRNGAGKSTTMKAIMGLIDQRQGRVQFNGQNISQRSAFEIARLGLGYVPEDRRIFTDLTVTENLEVGRQAARPQAHHWVVDELFELFPNLKTMPNRLGGQMSGGEQQMLTVARTLMGNPLAVLLDEPAEGVAPVIVQQMASTITQMKAQGLAVLLCEQNIRFAQKVADRVVILEKGQVVFSGAMRALQDDPKLAAQYLGFE